MEPLLALEQSGFAMAMRTSYFLYPLANVIHILAALVFFASIAAMDVRVLTAPASKRRVRSLAGCGLSQSSRSCSRLPAA